MARDIGVGKRNINDLIAKKIDILMKNQSKFQDLTKFNVTDYLKPGFIDIQKEYKEKISKNEENIRDTLAKSSITLNDDATQIETDFLKDIKDSDSFYKLFKSKFKPFDDFTFIDSLVEYKGREYFANQRDEYQKIFVQNPSASMDNMDKIIHYETIFLIQSNITELTPKTILEDTRNTALQEKINKIIQDKINSAIEECKTHVKDTMQKSLSTIPSVEPQGDYVTEEYNEKPCVLTLLAKSQASSIKYRECPKGEKVLGDANAHFIDIKLKNKFKHDNKEYSGVEFKVESSDDSKAFKITEMILKDEAGLLLNIPLDKQNLIIKSFFVHGNQMCSKAHEIARCEIVNGESSFEIIDKETNSFIASGQLRRKRKTTALKPDNYQAYKANIQSKQDSARSHQEEKNSKIISDDVDDISLTESYTVIADIRSQSLSISQGSQFNKMTSSEEESESNNGTIRLNVSSSDFAKLQDITYTPREDSNSGESSIRSIHKKSQTSNSRSNNAWNQLEPPSSEEGSESSNTTNRKGGESSNLNADNIGIMVKVRDNGNNMASKFIGGIKNIFSSGNKVRIATNVENDKDTLVRVKLRS